MTKETHEKIAFDAKRKKEFSAVTWIPAKNLSVVWSQSQRPLNEAHAKRIAADFDPEMFGTIAVTKPNGKGVFHIIDGHHRKVAVEMVWGENEKVPCQVFEAEDPARAAVLFDRINSNRRKMSAVETFHVRCTASYEVENAVNKIVKSCGYYVAGRGGKERDARETNKIACVGALMMVYQSYGGDILKTTLDLINSVWSKDDKYATNSNIVRGLGELISEYRSHIDWPYLRKRLIEKYPTALRLESAAHAVREMQGGSVGAAVKRLIVVTYNEGTRSKKKQLLEKR